MPLVTDALLALLGKQVEQRGAVVWYDPERAYAGLVETLSPERLGGTYFFRYEPEQGFVRLRQQVEPLWGGADRPPRLVIYVPLARADAAHALVEYEAGGVVMAPGQPGERNTSLEAVARRALAAVRPPAALEQIAAEVAEGKWSLAELDREAERGLQAQTGVLKLVFDTGVPAEIALRFLADPAMDAGIKLDARIEEKGALASLAAALGDLLGVSFRADEGIAALRARLARQTLVTDLLESLGQDVPETLRTFPVAERQAARQAAVELADAWRNRRDAVVSYIRWADQIEAEMGAGAFAAGIAVLAHSETFAAAEERLQREVELALVHRAAPDLVELAEARLAGFWSLQRPEIKARWDVIADAGRVLVEAARVSAAMKGKKWSAGDLALRYAQGTPKSAKYQDATDDAPALWQPEGPWCILDTAQRHLERDFHRFELDLTRHESLAALVTHARNRYAAIADSLAEAFTGAYAEDRYEVGAEVAAKPGGLPPLLHQADIYVRAVAPALAAGSVAYILVDALRYEMARELWTLLSEDWQATLAPALATPPTITEVGMAALTPGAERGLTIAPAGSGGLAAVVDGKTLKTRQDRLDHIATSAGAPVASARLDQLAPLSDPHLRTALKNCRLAVITATEEIDGLCENTPAVARRMLDDVLLQLRRAIKTLFGLGIQAIVISADHGYLFGERLTTGEGIDPPGGNTAALKRRAWVGKGGAKVEGTLRESLSTFGLGGDLEYVTPRNLSAFKAPGGAMEYFHGGLSLQELVTPVLTVRPKGREAVGAAAAINWKLALGSPKITTRFLSVTVEGSSEELLPLEPPIVRVEVRAGSTAVSAPVSASYGFSEATRDVTLALSPESAQVTAPVTVTLMITDVPAVSKVTIHLLDASTGISLARLDNVPISITM